MATRKQKAASSIGTGLAGAGTGALIGSALFPGVGTLLGALLGGGLGTAGGALAAGKTDEKIAKEKRRAAELQKKMQQNKKLDKKEQKEFDNLKNAGVVPDENAIAGQGSSNPNVQIFNRYTPEQQQAMSTALQRALAGLGNPNYAQERFAPIAQAARQKFAEEELPSIAQRFASMGGLGSTGFSQAATAAQAGLNRDLASLGAQYEQSYESGLRDLLGLGLKEQFDTIYGGKGGTFGERVLENLLANAMSGENIGAGLGLTKEAIQNLIAQRRSGSVAGLSGAAPFQYSPQLVNPGANQINSRNAMQAVVGAGAPNYFSPQSNSLQVAAPVTPPTTGWGAARALYNI